MSAPTLPHAHQRQLRTHFGFSRIPFRKNVPASSMFDSESQRNLLHGLALWIDLRGLALVTGPSGVGKSICLRRFVQQLPQGRYTVHPFNQIPTTPTGFLRALTRRLGLRPRLHLTDMFDDIVKALAHHEEEHGTHPVLVMDDAEGMRPATLDLVRRLTDGGGDGVDHVSILLAGTEQVLHVLRDPQLVPLQTRFGYAHTLRPFGIKDARNYVDFHMDFAAGGPQNVFDDSAIRVLFHASQGVPRRMNQLALQALMEAVVYEADAIDERMMKRVLQAHPLYDAPRGS